MQRHLEKRISRLFSFPKAGEIEQQCGFFIALRHARVFQQEQFYLKEAVKAKGRMEVSKWTGLFSGIVPGVISLTGAGCRKPKINMWVIYNHFLNYFSTNDLFSYFSP